LIRWTWLSPDSPSSPLPADLDVALSCQFGDRRIYVHTEVSPLQRLGSEPDLERARLLVELGHRQTSAVHADAVADVAVSQHRRRVGYGDTPSAAARRRGIVRLDVRDSPYMLAHFWISNP
jgi:hypothetical protein